MFLDVIDIQILDLLKENSRLKLTNIASKLKLTPATIKYRIDRLVETGIIDKFTISINKRKVGIEVSAFIVIYANSKAHIGAIIEALKSLTEFSKISVLMGGPDIVTRISMSSMTELISLIKKINRIEEIQTFDTWFVIDEIN